MSELGIEIGIPWSKRSTKIQPFGGWMLLCKQWSGVLIKNKEKIRKTTRMVELTFTKAKY